MAWGILEAFVEALPCHCPGDPVVCMMGLIVSLVRGILLGEGCGPV